MVCDTYNITTLIRTSEIRYSRSIGEANSNRVTSSLLRKRTRLPTHACEVGALTFEVTDNFGSNGVLPCGAYGPWWLRRPPPREQQTRGSIPAIPVGGGFFFRIEPRQWLPCQAPGVIASCLDWSALCQCTVAG